jgi:hypothetical protein
MSQNLCRKNTGGLIFCRDTDIVRLFAGKRLASIITRRQ